MDLDTVTASDPAAKSKARVVVDKVDFFLAKGTAAIRCCLTTTFASTPGSWWS